MKQASFKIDTAFTNGENPEEFSSGDIPYLDRCYGLVPRVVGAVTPDMVYPHTVTGVTHRDGNTFLKARDTFLLDNNTIQRLFKLSGLAIVEDIFTRDVVDLYSGDPTTLESIVGRPQLIQTGLHNVLIGRGTYHSFTETSDLYQATAAETNIPTTACVHNNRIIYAGFYTNATVLASATFSRMWKVAQKFSPNYDFSRVGEPFSSKYIMWSTVGGGAVDAPQLLEEVFFSGNDTTGHLTNIIEAAFRERLMGVAHFEWPGTILYCLPLGNRVMLYGDRGIGFAIPTEEGYVTQQLLDFGIHSRSSVDAGPTGHTFVDSEGNVWYIQNEYVPRNLQFSHKISAMFDSELEEDIRVVAEPRRGDFYITSPDKAYLLTADRKFSEAYYRPWSLLEYNSKVYGTRSVGSSTFQLRSLPSKLGRNAKKFYQTVEVERTGGGDITGYIDWRNKETEEFTSSPVKPLNGQDTYYPIVMASEAKQVLEGTITSDIRVSKMRVKWQGRDLTAIRGLTEQIDE